VIHRKRDHNLLLSSFVFIKLQMARDLHLLGVTATRRDELLQQEGGTMRSANQYAFPLSSKPYSTGEDRRRQELGAAAVFKKSSTSPTRSGRWKEWKD
jgi:hypothetical protein